MDATTVAVDLAKDVFEVAVSVRAGQVDQRLRPDAQRQHGSGKGHQHERLETQRDFSRRLCAVGSFSQDPAGRKSTSRHATRVVGAERPCAPEGHRPFHDDVGGRFSVFTPVGAVQTNQNIILGASCCLDTGYFAGWMDDVKLFTSTP